MMDTKLELFDDEIALAGSVNLDSRSVLLNYGLMTTSHGTTNAQRFADWFDLERRSASALIANQPSLLRDMTEGMLWLGFQL